MLVSAEGGMSTEYKTPLFEDAVESSWVSVRGSPKERSNDVLSNVFWDCE